MDYDNGLFGDKLTENIAMHSPRCLCWESEPSPAAKRPAFAVHLHLYKRPRSNKVVGI